ncbi:hypothetical protein MTIM_53710 [Mycobacterium timonense]|uniref:Uncharacterized protein n=1 Tax=Mycobacterium timonense TaxID=701043 RepID=A0A7I9ZFA5_9MYCO|nr:hypothetical protein MTIM_53710 [Mycobacterium timonense]
MPSRVPADQDTGFNEVNGGIRQVARWAVARSKGLVRPLLFRALATIPPQHTENGCGA